MNKENQETESNTDLGKTQNTEQGNNSEIGNNENIETESTDEIEYNENTESNIDSENNIGKENYENIETTSSIVTGTNTHLDDKNTENNSELEENTDSFNNENSESNIEEDTNNNENKENTGSITGMETNTESSTNGNTISDTEIKSNSGTGINDNTEINSEDKNNESGNNDNTEDEAETNTDSGNSEKIESNESSKNNENIDNTEENSQNNNNSEENSSKEKVSESFENNDNETCLKEEILNNKCTKNIDIEQISQIYNYLQNELSNNKIVEKKEIYTKNTVYQISTIEEQLNSDSSNVSSIDFGECETNLKNYYNISKDQELIVLKLDIKYEDTTYVQYEVYHPINKTILNLTICKNTKISIYLPVTLSDDVKNLVDSLEESGYNLFDLSDSFYTDICTPYTSDNKTDVVLSDRKNSIYSQVANLSFCQTGCSFQYYNSTTQRVKCNCKTDIENIKAMFRDFNFAKNEIISNFYTTFKNSNIKIFKCYKLLYDYKELFHNIGCIIMTILYLLLLICFIFFCFTAGKKIDYFIKIIFNIKKNEASKNNNIDKGKQIKSAIKRKKSKKKKARKYNLIKTKKSETSKKNLKLKIRRKIINKTGNYPPKKCIRNKLEKSSSSCLPNSKSKIIIQKLNDKPKIKNINNENNLEDSKPKYDIKIYKSYLNVKNKKYININEKNSESLYYLNLTNNEDSIQSLNDYELNNLEYKIALDLDKRTYYQYYLSLLKKTIDYFYIFLPTRL